MQENPARFGHWRFHGERDGAAGIALSDLPLHASAVLPGHAGYADVNATVIPTCTDFLAKVGITSGSA